MRRYRSLIVTAFALLFLSAAAGTTHAAEIAGVMMKDGKMMMMKDGKATGPMDHDMTMSNGTKVMTDGTMIMKDGSQMHMKDGQMMMMEGKMMDGGKAMGMDK
jgi:Domain of unknown function (DUF6799)